MNPFYNQVNNENRGGSLPFNQNQNQNMYNNQRNTQSNSQGNPQGNMQINQNPIDWTNNNAYKSAFPVRIKTMFNINITNQLPIGKENPGGDILIDENTRLSDYRIYEKELNDKKSRTNDIIHKSKKQFVNICLSDNKVNPDDKLDILRKIKENMGTIIESSDNLKHKLSKFSSYFKKTTNSSNPASKSPIKLDSDFSIFNKNNIVLSPPRKEKSDGEVTANGGYLNGGYNLLNDNNQKGFTNIYGKNFN